MRFEQKHNGMRVVVGGYDINKIEMLKFHTEELVMRKEIDGGNGDYRFAAS
jgi:hypothetical protein